MRRIFITFTLLWLTSTVQAAAMNIIQLTNRPAAEVIPVIEPMLGPGDAISGSGFKIFLRSSPQTLAEVKEIVAALDAPARVLQISVRQGSQQTLEEQGLSGNIQIQGGDGSASVGNDNTTGGGSVSFGADNVSGSISGVDRQQSVQNSPVHQVRVTEGREAYIETGRQIPFFPSGFEYNALTGFYVLPRVHGDNVTLEVSPFKSAGVNSNSSSIETQSATTTITGRMGQWLLIGGVTIESSRTQTGIGNQVSSESRREDSIWIKAEQIQ